MSALAMDMREQSAEVLEQFATGDGAAFETLFRQHQAEVYAWIVRIVRDAAAAEDLTLETFWRIHRAHARFDPQRGFGAWARKIATHVTLDHLKRAQVRSEQTGGEEDVRLAENLVTAAPADPGVQRELRERMQLAFQQLPPKLRAVAALALIEERPHAEIAEALNISTAAVKSRTFRAVQLLRRKLKDLGAHYE